LAEHNINFDYVNVNPECLDSNLCSFKGKFYFDLLFEDKAGFEPSDWTNIKQALIEEGEWDKKLSH